VEDFERREINTERLAGKLKESVGFESKGVEWRMVSLFFASVVCHDVFYSR
jgi:hypothetical protein